MGQPVGDGLDDVNPAEEAGLDRRRAVVRQGGVDLRGNHLRRQEVDGGHARAVLGGDGGDGAHAVDAGAEGGPRLQVGLQTGRAAGVGAGDG